MDIFLAYNMYLDLEQWRRESCVVAVSNCFTILFIVGTKN